MELSAVLVEQGQVGQALHKSIAADPISTLRGCLANQLAQIILAINYGMEQVY